MDLLKVNEDNFIKEVIESSKPVLVDFNAEWCGPCRMLHPILSELAMERKDYKFVSINIDDNRNLAEKYGIFSIPCLIVFKNGEETNRSVGLIPKQELEKILGD